ncbi:MAG: radical SAM protein [Eubacteriales bacterium]|nr:radical SAM protein [Eubacteriales bacterium]
MKSNVVIPVFVTHMGCPFKCIFCDQGKISGQNEKMTAEIMTAEIERHLATVKSGTHIEIGFYGGSFTGISEKLQFELLDKANYYLDRGKIQGIRLSTRPDLINEHVIGYLKKYGVGIVELGIQSLDEAVLLKSFRGYSPADAIKAMEMISSSGIRLGTQTMIGLPEDTLEKDILTARTISRYHPEAVRIYPTLVVKGTLLEDMYKKGTYKPLSLSEAVEISAQLLEIYKSNDINVIRIGLQPTADLNENSEVAAGPFHPAFRHLVESRLMLKKILNSLEKLDPAPGKYLTITSPDNNLSDISGHKRENIIYLKKKYGFGRIAIKHDANIDKIKIEL